MNSFKFELYVLLLSALISAGCKETKVPSLYNLSELREIDLYDSAYINSEYVGKIDISSISVLLAKADWSDTNFIDLGSWKLKTNDEKHIRLSYYGWFFSIDGIDGCFLIREEDKEEYSRFIEHLKSDIIIPWRLKKNQNRANSVDIKKPRD